MEYNQKYSRNLIRNAYGTLSEILMEYVHECSWNMFRTAHGIQTEEFKRVQSGILVEMLMKYDQKFHGVV